MTWPVDTPGWIFTESDINDPLDNRTVSCRLTVKVKGQIRHHSALVSRHALDLATFDQMGAVRARLFTEMYRDMQEAAYPNR